MEESILKSTKKLLGVADDDTSFDLDIVTHINTVFSILKDLGIGPEDGFNIIDDSKKWGDYDIGDGLDHSMLKTYVYSRVRLIFDPPQSMFLVDALERQISMFEWRISVNREGRDWKDPDPVPLTGGQHE